MNSHEMSGAHGRAPRGFLWASHTVATKKAWCGPGWSFAPQPTGDQLVVALVAGVRNGAERV